MLPSGGRQGLVPKLSSVLSCLHEVPAVHGDAKSSLPGAERRERGGHYHCGFMPVL